MEKRYASIWFPCLLANRKMRQDPALAHTDFVIAAPVHGKMVAKAVSPGAKAKGIGTHMVVADCKTIVPGLEVFKWEENSEQELLKALGEWCIRFSPVVTIDLPDGLIIDTTGCTHLWGGEELYLQDIVQKFSRMGYQVRVAIAGTIGTAWGMARFSHSTFIVPPQQEKTALLSLPPAALRLEAPVLEKLSRLGMHRIDTFINMPGSALRRRFGNHFLQRLHQALGIAPEFIEPLQPTTPYFIHLPCLEPVRTAKSIEIALHQLLEEICRRLKKEEMGIRACVFTTHRIDGKQQQLKIGTGRPSVNLQHLMKLFEHKLPTIEPALGIEVFTLEVTQVMPLTSTQDALWHTAVTQDDAKLAELLDRIANRVGPQNIKRYLPDEHYWPERSVRLATSAEDCSNAQWPTGLRPLHLLPIPVLIEVMVLLPDYPPKSFKYQGQLYKVIKADGPERIEQEWWLQQGHYRDYYCIEDETGARYWIFRLGHYDDVHQPQWFIHGFFA